MAAPADVPAGREHECDERRAREHHAERDEEQRAHIYKAARPREWTQQQLAGHLLDRAFSGSAKALLIGALSAKKTTKSELAELRKLLDTYGKEAK